MKVTEEFVITESPQALWEFFEQLDQVARCVPGVEEVTVVDADNSRVKVTQSLGPMTATFDVKMRITERDPGRSMQFTAVGRSVRGAAGNVRATHVVRLQESGDGATRVQLEGDLALGGMLGSVGQKVVAKQAAAVTQSFAQALQERLSGGPAEEPDPVVQEPAPGAQESAAVAGEPAAGGNPEPAPEPGPLAPVGGAVPAVALAGGIVLCLLLALGWLRSRSRH